MEENQEVRKPMEFTFLETKAMQMALERQKEDLIDATTNQKFNWTPEARKDLKDMRDSTESALAKVQAATGVGGGLPDLEPGEENDYVTKPS